MNDIERARFKRIAREYIEARRKSIESGMAYLKEHLPTAELVQQAKPFLDKELDKWRNK